ncbi:MAG: OmpA family protein [Candidatus Tectomicrobia bacterium]|uniref:OmpA family protein n=1 Tax=Tectimicrobiota bacterium TaxID=2528274 RepID=A0A932CQK0_UNCTE|nr:OmpA family protein [Candidatus Tectomicrobia bacterium]
MAKKKHAEEHENHERWLVSYADFITLLFAFFVVMYAMSSIDARKFKDMSTGVRWAFSFHGKGGSDRIPIWPGPSQKSLNVMGPVISDPSSDNADEEELQMIRSQISGALRQKSVSIEEEENTAGDFIKIRVEPRGLTISMAAKYLFPPGEAEVRPDIRPVVDKMARVLKATTRLIRIEGHTDNTPIHTPAYPTNWELSTARAVRLVRYFIEEQGFPSDRLSAAGCSEFRPVASNLTEEGRAANRRIDIVVLSRKEIGTESGEFFMPSLAAYSPKDRAFLEDFLSRGGP